MRNKLLTTVAIAALIGGTAIAMAQDRGTGPASGAPATGAAPSSAAPSGATPNGAAEQHGAPGGAVQHTPTAPGGTAQTQTSPGQKGMTQTEGAKTNPNGSTQDRAQTQERGKTDQNAQTQERGKTDQKAQTQERGKTDQNAQTQDRSRTQENAGRSEERSGKTTVRISENQRTQIKSIVLRNRDAARVDNVHFSVAVGTRVPRDIHVVELPADIVTIVPEYRGYDYIVVGDQILIIDPQTLEIVDIITA